MEKKDFTQRYIEDTGLDTYAKQLEKSTGTSVAETLAQFRKTLSSGSNQISLAEKYGTKEKYKTPQAFNR